MFRNTILGRSSTAISECRQRPVDEVDNNIGCAIVRGAFAQLSKAHNICHSRQAVCHSPEVFELLSRWLALIVVGKDCSARDLGASLF